jgi:acyl-CoA reductase-like NAD-dependent aldehyde dehydrogenase
LLKLADLIDENSQAIAYLESICSGRPLAMILGEVPRVSSTFRCEYCIDTRLSLDLSS